MKENQPDYRQEAGWKNFKFNQPYEKGLQRVNEVIKKPDFDPATLWQWGTMQATALIGVLKACERAFGGDGQKVVREAIMKVGLDVGRQILKNTKKPDGMSEAEFISFYATVINRIAYASLEEPTINNNDHVSFHIKWCPHQDYYKAFDCRVQRYFVQGMMDALQELSGQQNWQVRFMSTIPSGAETCHFVIWQSESKEGKSEWEQWTEEIEKKALEMAKKEK